MQTESAAFHLSIGREGLKDYQKRTENQRARLLAGPRDRNSLENAGVTTAKGGIR
jgi:hypothetical protein